MSSSVLLGLASCFTYAPVGHLIPALPHCIQPFSARQLFQTELSFLSLRRQTSGLHSKAENRRQPPETRQSPEVRQCVAQPRARLRPRHGRLHLPCGRTLPLRSERDSVWARTVCHSEERREGGVAVSRQRAGRPQLQQQPCGQRRRPRPVGAARPSVGESVGRGTTRHLCDRGQRHNLHRILFRLKLLSSEIK